MSMRAHHRSSKTVIDAYLYLYPLFYVPLSTQIFENGFFYECVRGSVDLHLIILRHCSYAQLLSELRPCSNWTVDRVAWFDYAPLVYAVYAYH